jgi:hypothetical protein
MVDSSVDETTRHRFAVFVRVGFVALVGLSAAMIGVHGGASPAEVGLVALVGAAFGALVLYVMRWVDWTTTEKRRRR